MKRAAVVGDLTGFGRCALTVALPTLSAMGIQACPLPTAIISAIPWHDSHLYVDLTDILNDYIAHWEKIGLTFDAALVGFMCSGKEIEIMTGYMGRLLETCRPLVVVDPVMGDGGGLYSKVSRDVPDAMQRLISRADAITPNLTEACLLTGLPYKEPLTDDELEALLAQISKLTSGAIIIKSVKLADGWFNVLYDNGRIKYWPFSHIDGKFQGCGDFFVSTLTGGLLLGENIEKAFTRACERTGKAVTLTWEKKTPPTEGLLFEELLSIGPCLKTAACKP